MCSFSRDLIPSAGQIRGDLNLQPLDLQSGDPRTTLQTCPQHQPVLDTSLSSTPACPRHQPVLNTSLSFCSLHRLHLHSQSLQAASLSSFLTACSSLLTDCFSILSPYRLLLCPYRLLLYPLSLQAGSLSSPRSEEHTSELQSR